jgi:uncharacterized protein (DUF302 family)
MQVFQRKGDRDGERFREQRVIEDREDVVMSKQNTDYALRAKLAEPYEAAVEKITAALKEEGFGVLTEIDVQATLKNKLDVDFRRYVILGACNPPLAHRALQADLDVGLLLPCNVIIFEEGTGSAVSIIDPIVMLAAAARPELEPVASEARARLLRVIEAVTR